MPAGFKIMPHTYPDTENVTVISGQFNIGNSILERATNPAKAGGCMLVPKGTHHYVLVNEDTLI